MICIVKITAPQIKLQIQGQHVYAANYYVMNSNFNVYICIENGSSGINTTGNASEDEPIFTDLEPSKAGESQDGYVWKYYSQSIQAI